MKPRSTMFEGDVTPLDASSAGSLWSVLYNRLGYLPGLVDYFILLCGGFWLLMQCTFFSPPELKF